MWRERECADAESAGDASEGLRDGRKRVVAAGATPSECWWKTRAEETRKQGGMGQSGHICLKGLSFITTANDSERWRVSNAREGRIDGCCGGSRQGTSRASSPGPGSNPGP
jgi:hypothetical protein